MGRVETTLAWLFCLRLASRVSLQSSRSESIQCLFVITVYSTSWCGDCRATKQALEALGIPYREIDIDHHPEAEQWVLEANGGRRSVPTLVYGPHAASMSRFSVAKLKGWLNEVGLAHRSGPAQAQHD